MLGEFLIMFCERIWEWRCVRWSILRLQLLNQIFRFVLLQLPLITYRCFCSLSSWELIDLVASAFGWVRRKVSIQNVCIPTRVLKFKRFTGSGTSVFPFSNLNRSHLWDIDSSPRGRHGVDAKRWIRFRPVSPIINIFVIDPMSMWRYYTILLNRPSWDNTPGLFLFIFESNELWIIQR